MLQKFYLKYVFEINVIAQFIMLATTYFSFLLSANMRRISSFHCHNLGIVMYFSIVYSMLHACSSR